MLINMILSLKYGVSNFRKKKEKSKRISRYYNRQQKVIVIKINKKAGKQMYKYK